MHPGTQNLLRYFASDHLPPKLKAISDEIGDVARFLANALPENAETTVALRKLLEAKDAAVRSALDLPDA